MGIFSKKVKEEEEENLSSSTREVKEKKKLARKKKKDSLPRAWSKKERTLVTAIFLMTILASGLLALSARKWKLPGFPRIKVKPLALFQGGVIELGGSGQNQMYEDIKKEFESETKKLSGVYGLYVIDLGKDLAFGVDQNETFQAASLIKLPVLAAMYIESELGNLDLDTDYTLKESDKIGGAGNLYLKPAGYKISYRNIIRLMANQSDNTAFNISRNFLGDKKIQEVMAKIGMAATSIETNETTPLDVGLFFKELYSNRLISETDKNELLEFLTDTSYENHLAAGLPDGVRIAHKYGREVHVVNDAGIVFGKNPFIVVIMGDGVVETEADGVFPKLSEIVYQGMEK